MGELGYQIWHLGMLGYGGRSRRGDERPVAIYWDELADTQDWRSQDEELYRLPNGMPSLDTFAGYRDSYTPNPDRNPAFDPIKPRNLHCCSTPVIRYEGDVVEATLTNEPVGSAEDPGLLFINYKAPDYTGHVYGMFDPMTGDALRDVDEQLGRLVTQLDTLYPNRYALIVTADHGQCPLPDAFGWRPSRPHPALGRPRARVRRRPVRPGAERGAVGGVPALGRVVGRGRRRARTWPSFLRDYPYRQNIGPYVPRDAIEQELLDRQQFAAVFATSFLDTLADRELDAGFGPGIFYPEGDPSGIPVL